MKITTIDIYRLSIPMEPFTIATGTMDYAQNVCIKVHTDQDLYGVGECSAFPTVVGETQGTCLSLAQDFAQIWKGKDPLDIGARMEELDGFCYRNTTIKSAFDMALYDLAAKEAGLPLYKYLGGKKRDIETDITIGIGTPEQMAEKAGEFKAAGARILKVKLGKGVEDDVRRIAAVRKACGKDMVIRIDANQGWSLNESLRALTALEEYTIEFCEQPMRTWQDSDLPSLRKQSPIKIMADESCYNHHDAERLIAADACDYINIKLSKSGGIHEALKIHAAAKGAGMPCMLGCMLESRLALTANIHFALACDGVRFYDMDSCLLGLLEDPVANGVRYNGYTLTVPDLNGIGAEIDQSFLDKCEKWSI